MKVMIINVTILVLNLLLNRKRELHSIEVPFFLFNLPLTEEQLIY